jgi:DNA polymerase-3 subunit gamma/tau
MASQSLYRKWRSQTFDELVGQEHVVQTLRNAIAEDRVAHAYLFTGPRGVGKTSMARLLAKAVNCEAEPRQRPCGVCSACTSIAEGRAVDVIEMDAASHTSVDDARDIIERVQFRPTSGRYKVYVIDEVHMLSTAAFNALLKTLEEPPDHAIFILATTEIHKVPATILSRCQRFTFTRHSIAQMADHLQRIAEAEGMQLDAGVAPAIARAATGSMRDAVGVLEQLGSFASDKIVLEQVQSLLGVTAAEEVDSLVQALLDGDIQAALHTVNSVADQGADMRQFTRDLVERLRALMLLATTQDHTLINTGTDDIATLKAWTQNVQPGMLVHWIRLLSNLDYQLRVSPYGHLPLELALVEALTAPAAAQPVAAPAPAAAPAAAKTRPAAKPTSKPATSKPAAPPPEESSEAPAPAAPANGRAAAPKAETPPAQHNEQPEHKPVPPAQSEPHESTADADEVPPESDTSDTEAAPPETVQEVQAELSMLDRVEAVWPAVVRDVRPRDNKLQAMLRDVYPVDVEGTTVVLLAKYPFHRSQIEKPTKRRIIEQVLSSHLGSTIGVRCTMQEQDKPDEPQVQIHSVRNDPYVKAVRNIFGAEIIDVE